MGQAVAIALELWKHHEPNRKHQKTKADDGSEQQQADRACCRLQPGGVCGGGFRRCAHGGHNNRLNPCTKGTVAALRSSMDLAEALEFSRYASRLRSARPELFAAVTVGLDSPFMVGEDDAAALGRAPDPALRH